MVLSYDELYSAVVSEWEIDYSTTRRRLDELPVITLEERGEACVNLAVKDVQTDWLDQTTVEFMRHPQSTVSRLSHGNIDRGLPLLRAGDIVGIYPFDRNLIRPAGWKSLCEAVVSFSSQETLAVGISQTASESLIDRRKCKKQTEETEVDNNIDVEIEFLTSANSDNEQAAWTVIMIGSPLPFLNRIGMIDILRSLSKEPSEFLNESEDSYLNLLKKKINDPIYRKSDVSFEKKASQKESLLKDAFYGTKPIQGPVKKAEALLRAFRADPKGTEEILATRAPIEIDREVLRSCCENLNQQQRSCVEFCLTNSQYIPCIQG